MERRDFIMNTLVVIGFRASLKGFEQLCDCVELYIRDRSATIESIYAVVAKKYGCSKSSVEKNLRRLVSSSGAAEAVRRLFGVTVRDLGNKEIVALIANYVILHRADYTVAKEQAEQAVNG